MLNKCFATIGIGLAVVGLNIGQATASTYDQNYSFVILTCLENGKGGINVVSMSPEAPTVAAGIILP